MMDIYNDLFETLTRHGFWVQYNIAAGCLEIVDGPVSMHLRVNPGIDAHGQITFDVFGMHKQKNVGVQISPRARLWEPFDAVRRTFLESGWVVPETFVTACDRMLAAYRDGV